MPRKLRVYRTSIGFFDLAVAAPSMKAAAEAWGANADIFRSGFAEETEEPAVVEAALFQPGVVVRRPVGSDEAFTENARLPKASASEPAKAAPRPDPKPKPDGGAAKREAAARKRLEAERQRIEKERLRLIAEADLALAKATSRHGKALEHLARQRGQLEQAEATEAKRWEQEQRSHAEALERAKQIG